jgi:hypothetical protein
MDRGRQERVRELREGGGEDGLRLVGDEAFDEDLRAARAEAPALQERGQTGEVVEEVPDAPIISNACSGIVSPPVREAARARAGGSVRPASVPAGVRTYRDSGTARGKVLP